MKARSIASVLALLIVASLAGLYGIGWALSSPAPARIGTAPPSLDASAVAFSSRSGSVVHGWLARVPAAPASILLLPGVRSNRLSMVGRAKFLRRAGYTTLLIDFQATGESPGDAITFGWQERFDVLAAVEYLKSRTGGRPVAIDGVSLGGAATLLATPPLSIEAAVLEAVYPSIDRAVANRLRMRMGPVGGALAPLLLAQLRPRLNVTAADLKPIDHIAALGCPLLLIGGADDRHTTADDTNLLFATAREPKQLWMIPGAAHVDYLEFVPDEYRRRVLAFLASALGVRS
jgi:uncharacterized protein